MGIWSKQREEGKRKSITTDREVALGRLDE
jgi:hypothetical protein